jgi:hypothetical protein
MSDLQLASYEDKEFAAIPRLDGSTLHLGLRGNADMHAIDPLTALLEALHLEALRLRVTEVAVDFGQLEFMNSACMKSFVTWIAALQETAPDAQYKVRFRSNPELRWQRRSLQSLSCFATNLITVETT